MAIGALLMASGAIATQVAQMQMRPEMQLTSGAVKFSYSPLFNSVRWFVAAGQLIAAVSGLGAIHWAIHSRGEKTRD